MKSISELNKLVAAADNKGQKHLRLPQDIVRDVMYAITERAIWVLQNRFGTIEAVKVAGTSAPRPANHWLLPRIDVSQASMDKATIVPEPLVTVMSVPFLNIVRNMMLDNATEHPTREDLIEMLGGQAGKKIPLAGLTSYRMAVLRATDREELDTLASQQRVVQFPLTIPLPKQVKDWIQEQSDE